MLLKGKRYSKFNNIEVIQNNKFTVRIVYKGEIFKIFKIIFHKEGGIFISLPYYKNSEGIVSEVILPANKMPPYQISLQEPLGKVTSHKVKYSHPPDGRVHFSQDGKVFSYFKENRKALPLSMNIGHLFTIMLQNLIDFDKDYSLKQDKQFVDFVTNDKEIEALKIVGEWRINPNYNFFHKKQKVNNKVIGPPINMLFHDHFLLLNIYKIQTFCKDNKSCLLFIGGFDPKIIADDLRKNFYCLAALYPASNYTELKKRIGSIDREISVLENSVQVKFLQNK